jgi:hypothetical protein
VTGGRWGVGALHKVLTVLPGVARLKRFELLPPAFVELGRKRRSAVGTKQM